jgi:hypothetical protein
VDHSPGDSRTSQPILHEHYWRSVPPAYNYERNIESEYRLRRTANDDEAPLPKARAASHSGRSAPDLWPDLQGAPVGAHRRSLAVIPSGAAGAAEDLSGRGSFFAYERCSRIGH